MRVIYDGVAIDLPDGATPIRVLEPVLIRAWLARRGHLYPGEADIDGWPEGKPKPRQADVEAGVSWPALLFALWSAELIELTGREEEPDAPLKVLAFAQVERVWSRFMLMTIPGHEIISGLYYDGSRRRRRFFDVHARPLPPSAPQPVPDDDKPELTLENLKAFLADLVARVGRVTAEHARSEANGYFKVKRIADKRLWKPAWKAVDLKYKYTGGKHP
jgi:hypothetical protein